MGIYVQLVTFSSDRGHFDEKKDTQRINDFLSEVQKKGARVISVVPSVGGSTSATAAVYVITYEAKEPVVLPLIF